MTDLLTELDEVTYAIQHNPNCPKRFLVRFVGIGASIIDYQGEQTTKDICGYGATLEEAIKEAIEKKRAAQVRNVHRANRQLERMLPGIASPTPFPRD